MEELNTIEAWCIEERPLAEGLVIRVGSRCMKVVKKEDLYVSIQVPFAREYEEILFATGWGSLPGTQPCKSVRCWGTNPLKAIKVCRCRYFQWDSVCL